MQKIVKIFITIIMIFGILLSNVPYYVVSSFIDSYIQTRGIVDKAWFAQQNNGDVVDTFSTLKEFSNKFKAYEAMAAVSYNSNGAFAYSASGGTSVSPAYPVSIAAYDLLILTIGMKPSAANGGSVTTPGGWTPIVSLTGAGGYGATLGADTGNTNMFTFYKVAAGTETGNLAVTIAANGVSWAQISRLSNASGSWSVAGTTGSDTSAGSVFIAFGADPGVTGGDYVIGAMTIPTNVTTPAQFSAEVFVQSGITFGAVTEIGEADSGTGNDIGGFRIHAPVSSGTSAGVPTMTATAGGTTTNVRGPGAFIRVRESNTAPTLAVTQPDGTGDTVTVGDLYNITYDLADPDPKHAVTAAMYYDADASGLNGTAITGTCATAAEGTGATCSWDTTGMTPGTYYVYGITNDGIAAQVSDYSSGVITINAPANALTVSISGTQATNLNSGDTAQHIGGGSTAAFQLQMSGSAVNVNSVKLTEQGTITLSDLTIQKLYYESAATCTYNGIESNVTGTPTGETVTFSLTGVQAPIAPDYLCLYYVFDLNGANAVGGETIDIEITNPSTDVVLASGQNTDTAAKQLTGTTTVKPQITGYINDTETDVAFDYSGGCTACGARIGGGLTYRQAITISGYGFGSDPGLGSRDTATNKVEVAGVSTTMLADDGSANTNVSAWSANSITIRTDTNIAGNADSDWGTNFGGASALKVTVGSQAVPANLNFYIFPQVTSVPDSVTGYTNAAREYDAGDTDGVVTLNGTRFGATQGSGATGGFVKILGCDSSACPGAADGSVAIDSWSNTQIIARVPTIIGDGAGGISDYVGDLVVRQGASTNNKTDTYTSGFRILPRITSITPSADGVNPDSRTLNGNHFCQSGSCLSAASWNAAADDGDDVKFGTTNAIVTGTPSDTAVAVTVPSMTPGNYTVTLSSSSYASNGKNFSYLDNTPVNPSSLNQYQSNCSTVITDETTTTSSTVCLKGAVSGGVTGGTLYLQVEVRDSATAFTAATAESAGVSAPAGGTESVSVTPGQGIFKWRARTCHYNNIGTHNLTCTGTGDYPSAAWVEFETGAVPTNDFTIDSNGPVIAFGSATPSEFTAAIVWTTDEAAVSRVNYGKTASYGFTLPKGTAVYTTNYVTSHTASISTNLTCGTLYHYQILVKDNQSNITADSDRTFTTSSCTNRIMRTIDYPISQETTQVSSFPTTLTRQFDAYIEEASPTVRNAYVEIEGISAGNSSMTLTAEVKKCNDAGCSSTTSGASRIYTLPASGSGPQPFKILHPIATSSTFSSAGCPGSCPTAITVDYPNNFLAGQIVQLTDYSGAPAESKTILTVTGSNKDVITFTTALANNYSALSTVVSKEFEPQDVAGSKNPNQLVMTLGAGPTNVSIIGAKLVVTYNYNP